MPWITITILLLLAGIIYAIKKTTRYIYMLEDWAGQCVYIGCSKAIAIDSKILPAAQKLGLEVISIGSISLSCKNDTIVPQDVIKKYKPIKISYPFFERMED